MFLSMVHSKKIPIATTTTLEGIKPEVTTVTVDFDAELASASRSSRSQKSISSDQYHGTTPGTTSTPLQNHMEERFSED
jgi:hypothetical protein